MPTTGVTQSDPLCNFLGIKWDSPLWIALSTASIVWGLIIKKNILGWNVGPFNMAVGGAGLALAAYNHFICKQ